MIELFKAAVERGASDIHVKSGDFVRIRLHGRLVPLTQQRLNHEQVRELAMKLLPPSRDAFGGGLTMVGAAEILARAGDADGALDLLDRLLGMPAGVEASVPLLRVDPAWDPLRNDPRFEQLLQRYTADAPGK